MILGNMQSTESKRETHGISDENKKEQILCENLQHIKGNRKNGQKGYTPEEVHAILGQVIKAVEKNQNRQTEQSISETALQDRGLFCLNLGSSLDLQNQG